MTEVLIFVKQYLGHGGLQQKYYCNVGIVYSGIEVFAPPPPLCHRVHFTRR